MKKAIEALKNGQKVRADYAVGYGFFYQLFAHDWIMLMEQVTSCVSTEVERMTEESFLTRGELTEFEVYEQ